ncbi:ABC-type molybdate transport system substrate-binding protein [Streptomyces glaucescens]
MSENESWRAANAKLALVIPVLVAGIAVGQVSLDGWAADGLTVFCAAALIAVLLRIGLNARSGGGR